MGDGLPLAREKGEENERTHKDPNVHLFRPGLKPILAFDGRKTRNILTLQLLRRIEI